MKTNFSSLEILESRIAPAIIIVNSLADPSESGKITLRDALALADSPSHPGPDTIIFKLPAATAPGANIIKLTGGELTSAGNVTIKGPGAGKLIIDAQGNSKIFSIDDGSSNDTPVSISGLSLINGNANAGVNDGGGAIFSHESLTLKNCVISGNKANLNGGGVYVNAYYPTATVSVTNCVISGNSAKAAGGLFVYATKSVVISGCTISGNSASTGTGGAFAQVGSTVTGITINKDIIIGNTAAGGYAGGLFVDIYTPNATSKVTISSSVISGNSVTGSGGKGGGIYTDRGNFVFSNDIISNNTAGDHGGGIYVSKPATSLTISKCTITGNKTTNTNAGGGGGIYVAGSKTSTPLPMTIAGSHITDNSSGYTGGGIYVAQGTNLTISSSTFSGNSAPDSYGGGIEFDGLGNLTVKGGVFSDNSAGAVGGIDFAGFGTISVTASKLTGNTSQGFSAGIKADSPGGTGIFKNVIATGNESGGYGGAMLLGGHFQVIGGSITGNSAEKGGGIFIYDGGGSATGSIKGVTISGNAATDSGGGVFNGGANPGTVTVQIAKVTGNTAPSFANYNSTNLTAFGPAAHAPAAGHGTFVVINTSDDVNISGSLPWALAQADAAQLAHPGVVNTIAFAIIDPQVNGAWDIPLTAGLTSKGNVKIVGPGAGKLIIDGGGKYKIFNIDDGDGNTDSPVTISGLSLIHGNASGNTAATGEGGAIYSNESLTLKNCTLSGNKAALSGGAVIVQAYGSSTTTVNILNCVISGNSAVLDGGGLSIDANKSVVISGCTVTGNTAARHNGGIYAGIKSTGAGSTISTGITISKDLIAGNTAVSYGGGIYLHSYNLAVTAKGVPLSKITISSSTITGNSVTGSGARDTGGGIYCSAGNFVFSKNIISNNTAVSGGGGIEASSATSLTITGGSIDGNSVSNGTGGGIDFGTGGFFNTGSAPLTVKGALITGNHASGNGGGVYLKTSGTVQITGSTINANGSGVAGGGIASRGNGALNITGGFISDNLASTDAGGGIYVFQGTDVKIQSAKITGNTATVGEGGGAYLNTTNTINIISSIIAGNQATDKGGGVNFGGSAVLTLKGDTFAGNTSDKQGGGMRIGPSLTGTIIGTKITGNIALIDGGGIYDNVLGPVTLGAGEAALITGNIAPTDPNQHNI